MYVRCASRLSFVIQQDFKNLDNNSSRTRNNWIPPIRKVIQEAPRKEGHQKSSIDLCTGLANNCSEKRDR